MVPFNRFPYNYYLLLDPEVDLDRWTLSVTGLVKGPGHYTFEQIRKLPKVTHNTRHLCIEGSDAIGNCGGVKLSSFLSAIGANPSARYIEVRCADHEFTDGSHVPQRYCWLDASPRVRHALASQ